MSTSLKWKKGFFKSTCEIISGGNIVGWLKDSTWRQSSEAEINGKKYTFKTKGFFKQETQIIDSGNQVIGKISYNAWMSKAIIEYSGKTVNWKYDNIINTKWSISDSLGNIISYKGSFTKGEIEYDIQDDLLLLTGLYIEDYYSQVASSAVIVSVVTISLAVSRAMR
ncbi:MAG: hypothetical protein HW421_3795 [Ignavibacteria bacterium]|nr:hypothetical protein [Ignavibacteria bacterium]